MAYLNETTYRSKKLLFGIIWLNGVLNKPPVWKIKTKIDLTGIISRGLRSIKENIKQIYSSFFGEA